MDHDSVSGSGSGSGSSGSSESSDSMPGLIPDFSDDVQCNFCGHLIPPQEVNQHMNEHINAIFNLASFPLPGLDTLQGLPFAGMLPPQRAVPPQNRVSYTWSSHGTTLYEQQFYSETIYDNDYEENLRLADIIGRVEVGIEDKDTVGRVIDNVELVDGDEDTCVVCINAIKETGNDARKLICNHIYCKPCIDTWLSSHKRCPVCNVDLEELLASLHKN